MLHEEKHLCCCEVTAFPSTGGDDMELGPSNLPPQALRGAMTKDSKGIKVGAIKFGTEGLKDLRT